MNTVTPNMPEAPGAKSAPWPENLDKLIARAEKGDKKVMSELRQWLDAFPYAWQDWGDMARMTEVALIRAVIGEQDQLMSEVLKRKMQALRDDVAGAQPSPLERLLAERVALCWLHVHYAETIYLQNRQEMSLRQAEFHQKRISMAQNRYLAAIRTLAQVRRLGVPVVQVNIAGQQVNLVQEGDK